MNNCDLEELKHIAWQKFLSLAEKNILWESNVPDELTHGQFKVWKFKSLGDSFTVYMDGCRIKYLTSSSDEYSTIKNFWASQMAAQEEKTKLRECARLREALMNKESTTADFLPWWKKLFGR